MRKGQDKGRKDNTPDYSAKKTKHHLKLRLNKREITLIEWLIDVNSL